MDAINISGGVNSYTANTTKIFILYEASDRVFIYWFDAQNPAALLAAGKFQLQNNAIVYVPPAGVSAWDRVVSQLLPSVGGAGSVQSMAE